MDEQPSSTQAHDFVSLVAQGPTAEALTALDDLVNAPAEVRQAQLRLLRGLAEREPTAFDGLLDPLADVLTAAERPGRLTTAKLFVAVADGAPDAVVSTVPALAGRLSDESEFYFVRARCAEALGYVAVSHPNAVATPELVANLRIGLEFDEPEVREKLAKALAHIALGDPCRLRHQVESLAEHLDTENKLIRYYLSSTLVAIGCACPEKLTAAADALVVHLDDDSDFVRGRAAEALGLLARANADVSLPMSKLMSLTDGDQFVAERAQFALAVSTEADCPTTPEENSTIDCLRERTEAIAEEIRSSDAANGCPHCGLSLPESGPPMCPSCGTPL